VKLVNLMQVFTSPRFLYAAEGNHAYVTLLLETFNNIIQYQYEGRLPSLFPLPSVSLSLSLPGNVNLIYSVVRRKEIFERLANLTLPIAIKVPRPARPSAMLCADPSSPRPSSGSSRPGEEKLSHSLHHRRPLLFSATRRGGLHECS
jgi:hypothetical protein